MSITIEPPRGLRERFVGSVVKSTEYENGAAERAWSLILDAWRVIDVASARADRPASPNREEWMAALRVAIFRAEYPEATSIALDDTPAAGICGWEECC